MAGHLYRIETQNHKAFAAAINEGGFFYCEMIATTLSKNQVLVREIDGNCVDALHGVMDRFPNTYYIL